MSTLTDAERTELDALRLQVVELSTRLDALETFLREYALLERRSLLGIASFVGKRYNISRATTCAQCGARVPLKH